MFSNSFARLKQIERPAMFLTKALIVLFWLCAGIEVYERYFVGSEKEFEFLFSSMGGGVFAVLFYLCIVHFSLLPAFQKTSGSNQVAQRFVHVRK
jgi:hypothetical protein|tara:strand:- start:1285 stop:1569 length:285 start_codon:yes stop_codon:yes gene_type:complete